MRRLVFFLLALGLMLSSPVYAHDVESHPGPMKQDKIESPAIQCDVTYRYEGHSYRWTYRMVGDGDEPIEKEQAWLRQFCKTAAAQDAWRFYSWVEDLDPPSTRSIYSQYPLMPDEYIVRSNSR